MEGSDLEFGEFGSFGVVCPGQNFISVNIDIGATVLYRIISAKYKVSQRKLASIQLPIDFCQDLV